MKYSKAKETVTLGARVTIEDIIAVARFGAKVEFSEEYISRVEKSRALVEKWTGDGRAMYGVTTGFGSLCTKAISGDEAEQLQHNIIMFSSKIGNIKIGGEKAKPIMSRWNWFVISLCGGIATGIVFWGIAEPVTHYMSGIPLFPDIKPETAMAAKLALSTTYLHWGLSEYAYYCVAGIVIGVAVYNMKLPYRISSCGQNVFARAALQRCLDISDIHLYRCFISIVVAGIIIIPF